MADNGYICRLFSGNTGLLTSDSEKTVCRIHAENGYNDVSSYHLFPGIQLMFNEVHGNPLWAENTDDPLIELNYCQTGRYECGFGHGTHALVREGDFAASIIRQKKVESRFPLGYYRGISLVVHPNEAQAYMDQNHPELQLRVSDLAQRLCPASCYVVQTKGALRDVFEQLYEMPVQNEWTYYRVKILELLVLLSELQPCCERCATYAEKDRDMLMRKIAEGLRQDFQEGKTLQEIAQENGICLTLLKREFTRLYGLAPGAYRKRARMEKAAHMLSSTNQRIIDIAADVGYENASKFSAAFRAEMGMTPAAYRKAYACLDSSREACAFLE